MRSAGQILGAFLVVVGIVFLLATVQGSLALGEILTWLWPLLLVGLGLWFVAAAAERRRSRPSWGPGTAPGTGGWDAGAAATDSSAWPADVSPSTAGSTGWPANAGGSAATATTPGQAAASTGWAGPEAAPPRTAGAPAAGAEGAAPGARTSTGPGAWDAAGAGAAGSAWGTAGAWPRPAVHEQRFLGEVEVGGVFDAGPMRIETFIGEIRVDLTRATFPDGETPIRVNTGIGEVRVLLPADVPAAVRVSTLLGEAEAIGHTAGPVLGEAYGETEGFATAQRRIRLEAQALIGEVAVRRARPDPAATDAPGSGFAPMSRPAPPAPAPPPDGGTEPPA